MHLAGKSWLSNVDYNATFRDHLQPTEASLKSINIVWFRRSDSLPKGRCYKILFCAVIWLLNSHLNSALPCQEHQRQFFLLRQCVSSKKARAFVLVTNWRQKLNNYRILILTILPRIYDWKDSVKITELWFGKSNLI
jgi:hypothetical protein